MTSPPPLRPHPPRWVNEALHAHGVLPAGEQLDTLIGGPLALLTRTVANAAQMKADALRAAVGDTYAAIGRTLKSLDRKPIRFWNYLPDPAHAMGDGLDRYMVFNAGRYDGFATWNGDADIRGGGLATASAVGIAGNTLVIHCLASTAAGTGVENPRQQSSWRYSTRYGPVPPCFSRATIAPIHDRRLLLIGGTASVVGEDTWHAGNSAAQLEETLRNLSALIAAARRDAAVPNPLASLTDLRVYVKHAGDAPHIEAVLRDRCPAAARMEMALARICRPELLIEIEGVAEI